MVDNIKISVIIPIYNAERYLEQCLDSIIEQSLDGIEIICINDGSTDNSKYILDKYGSIYHNIIVMHIHNVGAGLARNEGLKKARGEYVIFVDSDDFIISKSALELMYEKAIEEKVMVCGGSLIKYINGVYSNEYEKRREKNCFKENEVILFKDYQYPYAHQRFIISRKLLLENNIKYPSYKRGEDVIFLAEVLHCAKQFYALDLVIYAYRLMHKEEKIDINKAEDFIYAMRDILKLSIDNNYCELFSLITEDMNTFARNHLYCNLLKDNKWVIINETNKLILEGGMKFQIYESINKLMNKDEYINYLNCLNNLRIEYQMIIKSYSNIVIYGAGKWGIKILEYLRQNEVLPTFFVVTNQEANITQINNIKVIGINELNYNSDTLIILGVSEGFKSDIKHTLDSLHYKNILDFNIDILNN